MKSLIIKKKIKTFENRFVDLRKSTCRELATMGTSPQDLRITLMTLPTGTAEQHDHFIIDKYHIFQKAETVEDIFIHLNFYLSFLNYNLLAHIIKFLEPPVSRTLQRSMDSYCQDIELFKKETMTIDIIPYLPRKSTRPDGYSKLKLKIDINIKTTSLEDLRNTGRSWLVNYYCPTLHSSWQTSRRVHCWLFGLLANNCSVYSQANCETKEDFFLLQV